jgi:uncharacterized membrane protein YkoI
MNTNLKQTLTSKRILIPAVAAVAVLGVGGVAVASVASGDEELSGDDFDRASAAALDHVGGGEVTDAERSDDRGEAYEVEVTRPDGREVDVVLDADFVVMDADEDGSDGDDDDGDDDGREADDRPLSAGEVERAERAARAAVPGRVTEVDLSDDRVDGSAAAYEVEIVETDGQEWTVWLDYAFAVVGEARD